MYRHTYKMTVKLLGHSILDIGYSILEKSCPYLSTKPKFDEVWLNQRHSVLGYTYKNNFSPDLSDKKSFPLDL